MEILADVRMVVAIAAPLEDIDLTEWLFTLRDDEYRACSRAHIASGVSKTPEGKRMSINVEMPGQNLIVQHYVEDVVQRDHCLVRSISDTLAPSGKWSKLDVLWEVTAERNGNETKFTNHVRVGATEDYLRFLREAGVTDLGPVKEQTTKVIDAHNREETPLFAKNIETKALARVWRQT